MGFPFLSLNATIVLLQMQLPYKSFYIPIAFQTEASSPTTEPYFDDSDTDIVSCEYKKDIFADCFQFPELNYHEYPT